jgi:type I restriction enzyme S subunit
VSVSKTAALADVAEINPPLNQSLKSDELVAFVPMSRVLAGCLTVHEQETRTYGEVAKGYTPFVAGDVLVAKITPCFENGKIAQAQLTHRAGFGSTEFHVVRPRNGKLDARYALHFLRQDHIRYAGERKMTGSAGQKRVPEHFLSQLEIPLPALAEQRRIAGILDKAEWLRAQRSAALAKIDLLPQAIFLELFGECVPITFSNRANGARDRWSREVLSDVAQLATGHTPDRERPDYWNGNIPWISLTDIRDLDGKVARETRQSVTELGIQHSSAVRLPRGTVCFSRTASVGFVTIMGCEMATSQDFVNWMPGPRLDSIYLMWAFIRSREQLRGLSSGSTHKTIYMRFVEQFRVAVPPIELQREFARRVSGVEKLKAAQSASLEKLDALFASLQHRAFRGEL